MKNFIYGLLLLAVSANAQDSNPPSTMDALQYGVVLDHPGMKNVVLKSDVLYLSDAKGKLHMDVYQPPGLQKQEQRPAIVFLNGVGDQGESKVKSWGIYTSWPRLMAAHGYIGISMECDGERIQESLRGIFDFITKNASQYNIDPEKLGVYASSANVREGQAYLMGEQACKGIKAAALYYGDHANAPFRKDLPVLAVIVEGDVRPGRYDNLWKDVLSNKAPWTIRMASQMPHAFDAFTDNEEARRVILETISFWKNHLDPVPAPAWKPSKGREALAAIYMGDRERALNLLSMVVAENPEDVQALSVYANELGRSGQTVEAETVLKKALKLYPDNFNVQMDLIAVLYKLDKTAEAEKHLASALNSGKMDANDFVNLGYNLLIAGKDVEAANLYEKAIAMRPRAGDYYNLACAYSKSHNPDKAFAALEKAIELGYDSRSQFEGDADLLPLKSDSRYKTLIDKTK